MEISKILFINMLILMLVGGIALGIGIANDYVRESPVILEQCEGKLLKCEWDFKAYEHLVQECDKCIQKFSGENNTLMFCSELEE